MISNSHRYCSVRECKNYVSDNVSMHSFPQDTNLAKEWKIKLKISKPITKFMCVCSEHFKADDFTLNTRNRKLKRLKKGVIPSQKIPKGMTIENKKPRIGSSSRTRSRGSSDNLNKDKKRRAAVQPRSEIEMVDEVTSHKTRQPRRQLTQYQERSTNTLNVFVDRGVQTSFPIYNSADVMNSNYSMKCFTGVDVTLINTLVDCSINALTFNSEDIPDNLKLRIVLVLFKLKHNLSFECLAIMFNLPKTICTGYFYSTLSLLAIVLRPIVKWPTREEIQANTPGCIKKFENTRVVLKCIDITVQKSKILTDSQKSYLHCKNTLILKILTGITPSGLIAYVGPCYGERTSDKAVSSAEDITFILDPHEGVIVNKGFSNEEECEDYLVKLNQPSFLDKKKHSSKKESTYTTFTPNSPRTPIHVDRAIQKMKSFKIISSQIEWFMIPHMDDAMTVIAGLLNLSPPILSSETF
nr:uncharacterized protein LOC111502578 [Leptinotarsa decemlineata]